MKNLNINSLPKKQNGYVLLLVMVFLTILLIAIANFLTSSTQHTKDSGGVRDMTESLLMAESAMNMAMGQFLSSEDSDKAINITTVVDDQAKLTEILNEIPYMFYINKSDSADSNEINQTTPALLQIIANGEASNGDFVDLNSPRLVTSDDDPLTNLRINDLFDDAGEFRPYLFTLDPADGLLVISNAATWNDEAAVEKAAAWIEVTINPDNDEAVDIFIQATANVDGVKSYLQRFVGSYIPSRRLGNVELLVESSTIDRRRAVDH